MAALETLAADLSVALTNARLHAAEPRRASPTLDLNHDLRAAAGRDDLVARSRAPRSLGLRGARLEKGLMVLSALQGRGRSRSDRSSPL